MLCRTTINIIGVSMSRFLEEYVIKTLGSKALLISTTYVQSRIACLNTLQSKYINTTDFFVSFKTRTNLKPLSVILKWVVTVFQYAILFTTEIREIKKLLHFWIISNRRTLAVYFHGYSRIHKHIRHIHLILHVKNVKRAKVKNKF